MENQDQIAADFEKDSNRLAVHLKMVVTVKVWELYKKTSKHRLATIVSERVEYLVSDYYNRVGPTGLIDILGYLEYAVEHDSEPSHTIFDIHHDLGGDKWTMPRTQGYSKYLKIRSYTCSKCKGPRLARDIIYRIERSDCAVCPDWNLCSACFDEMGPVAKKAIENNPKIIKLMEW